VRNAYSLLLWCLAGLAAAGCASTGAVPRPFPGAPVASPTAAMPAPADLAEPLADPPRPSRDEPGVAETTRPTPAATIGALALASALELKGVRYLNGGSDPSGFDCSGLVQYVFARQGVGLPREVRQQYTVGYAIARDQVRPGDLLFFNTDSRGASHVAIAIDQSSFVHAPNARGVVRVEQISTAYWARRFIAARRIE
jgi:cell wall-associated NlpC family hydrolase